jgi:hypothetical protein
VPAVLEEKVPVVLEEKVPVVPEVLEVLMVQCWRC